MLGFLKLSSNRSQTLIRINKIIKGDNPAYCCAINANILVECFTNDSYQNVITNASFNICDGINVKRIYNYTQKNKVELYPGPDMFIDVISNRGMSCSHFFLGGQHKVLNGLLHKLKYEFEDIDIRGSFSPPFLDVSEFDYSSIAKRINDSNADIIWIGLGAPKQEIFMSNLLPHINRGLMVGVGAAFNFYSGLSEFKRAPDFMVNLHLEWLFRAFQEPKRIIKRQLKNLLYLPLIFFNEFKVKK